MTTILAIDTATNTNTVSICRAEDDAPETMTLLAETIVDCNRLHAERLIGTIDWILQEAGCTPDMLDGLAVSIGPGSFTGLRIGVSTMKGLAFAYQLPLMGVPTLDAMSHLVSLRDGLLCTLLDARMKEVFGAAYQYVGGNREKCLNDTVCPVDDYLDQLPEAIESPIFIGDGAVLYRDAITARYPAALFASNLHNVPRASAIAREAFIRLAAGEVADAALVAPVYLRKSQAEINAARKTVKL